MAARRKRRDTRALALIVAVSTMAATAALIERLPDRGVSPIGTVSDDAGAKMAPLPGMPPGPNDAPVAVGKEAMPRSNGPDDNTLTAANEHLQAGRISEARQLLEAAIARGSSTALLTALGYVHLADGQFQKALASFDGAIDAKPDHAQAYFGMAVAHEALDDLEAASGAMRSFLHLVDNPDPYAPEVIQARSALWEWEARLGRGPWGETRGIPPGLTEADVRRDGTGIGMLSPMPDGTSRVVPKPSIAN